MEQKEFASFWGRVLLIVIIFNFILAVAAIQNISALSNNPHTQDTAITLETSGPIIYKSYFFDNPPRLVLNFEPQALSGKLKEDIFVNRGMVKKIHCRYYNSGAVRWLKTITFVLLAKTSYSITDDVNTISISIQDTPEESINSTLTDELVIKDYMPSGWGTAQRREAIKAAITFLKIKRQMTRAMTRTTPVNELSPFVLVEKKSDNSVRISAVNLTPVEMITTGTKVLLNQPLTAAGELTTGSPTAAAESAPKNPAEPASGMKTSDFGKASLGFLSLVLGVLLVDRINTKRKISAKKHHPAEAEPAKDEKKIIEELFLKEEELQKWPKYHQLEYKTTTTGSLQQLPRETVNLTPVAMDIAERRRFPRADIRNSRGILNRALVGSKTQPFKNIRLNDISKGGLSFMVRSKEIKFRQPTVVKLYFANSSRPVDVWVKVVWEKDDDKGEGKNVGAKFTKVPKESWDKIMEAFGHRLG